MNMVRAAGSGPGLTADGGCNSGKDTYCEGDDARVTFPRNRKLGSNSVSSVAAETGSRIPRPSSRLRLLETVAELDVPYLEQELAGRPTVFVNEPSLIQAVLVASAASFEKSEFQQRVMGVAEGSETGLGNGMLTSSNGVNRQQRKLMGRIFSPSRMNRYVLEMAALSVQQRDEWADGEEVELGAAFMRLSTRIVAKTLFSWDLTEADASVFDNLALIGKMLGRSAEQRRSGWDDPSAIERAGADIEARLLALVAARRGRALEPEQGDVIDLLEAARVEADAETGGAEDYVVTDRQIRDDLMTLFITGAENPRNALTWALYLLTRHPDAAARVRAEVRAASAQSGDVTLATLERCPFTLQVYKETLRLFPPGYAFGRRAVEDVAIGPLRLARGTEVVISPYALHRRSSLFENPSQFMPQRFDRPREANLLPYAYLPFGVGPRSCIGGGFALLEGHVVLAVLLGGLRFDGLSSEVVLPEPRMTLRPSAPVRVLVQRETGGGSVA
jgi:cytochrome P450